LWPIRCYGNAVSLWLHEAPWVAGLNQHPSLIKIIVDFAIDALRDGPTESHLRGTPMQPTGQLWTVLAVPADERDGVGDQVRCRPCASIMEVVVRPSG